MFAIGNAIWGLDMPEDGTPVPEVVDFYADTADRIVIGGSLSLLSIAVFLVFGAALRQVLKDAGGEDFLATAAFGGLVLGMAAGIGAESINLAAALRAQDDELTGELAQSLFEISQILGSAATGVGLGVFALATAAVALRTGAVLPRWLAIGTAVLGALLLTPLAHVNWVAGVRARPARRADRRGAYPDACTNALRLSWSSWQAGQPVRWACMPGIAPFGVLARHLELDVAVELLEALLAGELRPLGAEQ